MPVHPPRTSVELAPVLASITYARCIASNVAHKLVVRRVRSRGQVTSDYDQGEWKDILTERRWERCATLEDYVLGTSTEPITALIEGRLSRVPMRDYYRYRTEVLVDVLRQHAGGAESLVELGSGAGRNLFALAYAGPWKRLHGLELSATGREVSSLVAQRYGLSQVTTSHIDLLNRESAGFAELRGATAFSFYCLEQLPAFTREVMTNLIAAGVRRVIHIEPTPELFSRTTAKDLATVSYIWRQDYQRTIVQTARALESEGLIRVLDTRRLNFAPTCRNDPTLVVWEPAQTH